ncbi:MAG: phytanoyl-CoA dioxygenase family protein [Anaerolineae bacterium]|nr:phytanoyl-CoA dioxygenase family protein [Anaerolineae bacterium]
MKDYQVLSESDAQHFFEKGYVVIKNCFSPEKAHEYTDLAWERLGYDPQDPETWLEGKIHMPTMHRLPVKEFSPKAYGAICDLMGGEERVKEPTWGDGFILNLKFGADRPWVPPSPEAGGWHVDGDFFRHFLDSPEQGLLTVVMWSDIYPQSGGTYVAPDSPRRIARHLAAHPEGLHPHETGSHLINECEEFLELTGMTGDVALIHPFMLHASSQNPSGRPRFMTNPPVQFQEPMNFNRDNPDDYSLVEQVVLDALGVDHYDFQPTAPREAVVPERVRRQQKMLEEEKARLNH